jgi:hypothetical protein
MPIYGTHTEENELSRIRRKFIGIDIVNPASFNSNPEKKRDKMQFCYRLIDGCQFVVFSKRLGVITGGVGLEVNYALAKKKKVYELGPKQFRVIKKPVQHLNYEETLKFYRKHGFGIPDES